ncbi:hypothetical protein Y1Q_0012928 [Alligator mississippiensis]|uniref:Uncharacterized protein n=1 Tax=Alligator mississippiensis TaxID=8496 RepID=A0A151P1T8_ALLMI|nr:hypothetical protein Y1Q_0012928 [Alligator mississippiensis]
MAGEMEGTSEGKIALQPTSPEDLQPWVTKEDLGRIDRSFRGRLGAKAGTIIRLSAIQDSIVCEHHVYVP